MSELMRINKYLASCGVCSRREVDRLIEKGKIKVNGQLATSGMKVSSDDKILVDGKKVGEEQEKKVYYLLNKPLNVICASKDDRGRKTVVDLIKTDKRIFPVGRLDYNTSGLIILTNDGELYNRVIHPRAKIYKTYEVVTKGSISRGNIERLKTGVKLEDGKTLPAKVGKVQLINKNSKFTLSIREGKNRQIRRMCSEIGHPVISLKRVEIGKIELGNLKVGKYRELTKEEINYLMK